MNLKKMLFWNARDTGAAAPAAEPISSTSAGQASQPHGSTAKVIPMPTAVMSVDGEVPWEPEAPSVPRMNTFPPTTETPVRVKGLMNAPELEGFFGQPYFGFGRYNGSHYHSHEALEMEVQAIVSKFQNVLLGLVDRRQARLDMLEQKRQEVASLSPSLDDRLRLAIEQMQREMTALLEQVALAEQRKGWVLQALNSYRLGFDRGVREALNFQMLNA